MAAMSIDDFITTYIDFGEYNGLFPEEQLKGPGSINFAMMPHATPPPHPS